MSPAIRTAIALQQRLAAEAELTAAVAGDEATAGMLAAGIAAGQAAYRNREAGKNAAVKMFGEPKLAFQELGRRMAERGAIAQAKHIFMLTDSELDGFLADPSGWSSKLAERYGQWQELFELELQHGRVVKYPEAYTTPILRDTLDYMENQKALERVDGGKYQVVDAAKVDALIEKFLRDLNDQVAINLKFNRERPGSAESSP
jgi:sulfur relay (sulfurtransferase) DsrC/TusE family protein